MTLMAKRWPCMQCGANAPEADYGLRLELKIVTEERDRLLDESARLLAEREAILATLPKTTVYLDPPDGGSVPLIEQVQRMADDAKRWRAIDTLWANYIAVCLRQDEDGAWSISTEEGIECAEVSYRGEDPHDAIDAFIEDFNKQQYAPVGCTQA